MKPTVAGIQARLSSTRLPGKVLADLGGKPLIERVVERTRAAESVDLVVVVTSEDPSDDPLVEYLEGRRIPVRRGPLQDVLQRYAQLLEEFEPGYVVRVTGDCPLIEPGFVDRQVAALRAFDADFVTVRGNELGSVDGTLCGQSTFSARALEQALASTDPRDREHVGSFFFQEHRDRFRHVEVEVDPIFHRRGLRLCVDEPADLEFVRAIYARFGSQEGGLFPLAGVLTWLDANPEFRALNQRVVESADNRELKSLVHSSPVKTVGSWPAATASGS